MANVKKVPLRKCIGCNEMKNKKEMIRVLKTMDDQIILDATGKKERQGCLSLLFQRMPSEGNEKQRTGALSEDADSAGSI